MDAAQHKARFSPTVRAAGCPRTAFCPLVSARRSVAFACVAAFLCVATPAAAQSQPSTPPVTQSDKLLHAGASAAVVDVVWGGCALLDQPLWVRIVAGVSAGAVVGVGKEAVDLAGFGTPDVNDLLFDGFGIGLGVAIALLAETATSSSDRTADAPAP